MGVRDVLALLEADEEEPAPLLPVSEADPNLLPPVALRKRSLASCFRCSAADCEDAGFPAAGHEWLLACRWSGQKP